jgi:hypothetical protein
LTELLRLSTAAPSLNIMAGCLSAEAWPGSADLPRAAAVQEVNGEATPASSLRRRGKHVTFSPEQQERYISIWAKAVDTQMHFNEMSVKSRQLGLTFVAAALGVGIVLLSRGDDFSLPVNAILFTFQIHIAVILLLGAWLALLAVRGLDLNVYHKMLRGAVTFGEDFEEHYMKRIFDLNKGMTQAISHYSCFQDASKQLDDTGRYAYTGRLQITAEDKIKDFYKNTIRFLLAAALVLFIVTNIASWVEPGTASVDSDQAGIAAPPQGPEITGRCDDFS